MRGPRTWGFWMRRYGLRDDQFSRIEHLSSRRPGRVGRDTERGNQLFVEAVIWKFRSGAPWRDLPEHFGPWKNNHTRFSRWAKAGVWEKLFKALADDPNSEYAMIKQFRGIATRYQKTAQNLHAGLDLVSAMAWLK
jgi:transposase